LHDDSADDSDEHFGTFLERILPLYFSDPDRYLPEFEQTLKGTHLSSYASKAQTAADKLHPRSQSHDYVNIRAKVLIIQGTVDWVCPVEVSERMHVAVPGSTLSLYANVGHLPWIEQPKRFFAEVALFLGVQIYRGNPNLSRFMASLGSMNVELVSKAEASVIMSAINLLSYNATPLRACNRSRAGDVGSDRTGSDSLGGPTRRISRHPFWVKLWSQVPGCRLHAYLSSLVSVITLTAAIFLTSQMK
jgi:hypothetical protein